MPAKNSTKIYQENGYYHIFNRGVAKQRIFLNSQDYKTFLSFLKIYLSPKDKQQLQLQLNKSKSGKEKQNIINIINLKNFSKDINLLAYCLMPNHFHLLIKQKPAKAIKDFMHALITKYSMYFNKKYHRVGAVFQGRYKAVLVKSDNQLLHLSRYIHQNPLGSDPHGIIRYKYSSLGNYLGKINQPWVKPNEILSFFKTNHPNHTYKNFVIHKQSPAMIKNLILK